MEQYIVYVNIDEQNRVRAVNSSAFLVNANGWIEIDRGTGDRFHHAQGNYFPLSLTDERGIMRYKIMDGLPVERTQQEMDVDYNSIAPSIDPKDEKIAELEEQVAILSAAILNI